MKGYEEKAFVAARGETIGFLLREEEVLRAATTGGGEGGAGQAEERRAGGALRCVGGARPQQAVRLLHGEELAAQMWPLGFPLVLARAGGS